MKPYFEGDVNPQVLEAIIGLPNAALMKSGMQRTERPDES